MHDNPLNLQSAVKYTQHFTKHVEKKINALRTAVKAYSGAAGVSNQNFDVRISL